ncbi:hypothetical protein C8J56DRAFT_1066733 [Mycena floridula]|nr:hypothetical protein C8J56DRAFT_1066733 [Mycena floridula]
MFEEDGHIDLSEDKNTLSSSESDSDNSSEFQGTVATAVIVHEDEISEPSLVDISASQIRDRKTLWTDIVPDLPNFESSKALNIKTVDLWCHEHWSRRSDHQIPLYIPHDHCWEKLNAFDAIRQHISGSPTLFITLCEHRNCCRVFILEGGPDCLKSVHILGAARDAPECSSILSAQDRKLVEHAWHRVADFMNWEARIQGCETHILTWNIPRDKEDSGVLAAQIVDHVLSQGLTIGRNGYWTRPLLPCTHGVRLRMMNDIFELLTEATSSAESAADQFLAEGQEQLSRVTTQLRKTMADYCLSCKQEIRFHSSSVSPSVFSRTKNEAEVFEIQSYISHTWMSVYGHKIHLTTLLDDGVLDAAVVDLCLSLEWNSRGQPPFGYLPQYCPSSLNVPEQPMMSLLWDDSAYYVTLFAQQPRCIHILGLLPDGETQERQSNASSAARDLWSHLFPQAMVHQPIYRARRWKGEPGADFLTTACQTMLYIWNQGFHVDADGFWKPPRYFDCSHMTRAYLLRGVQICVRNSSMPCSESWEKEFPIVCERIEDEKNNCPVDHTKELGEDDVDLNEDTFQTNLTWSTQPSKLDKSVRDKIRKVPWAQGARNAHGYIDGSLSLPPSVSHIRQGPSAPKVLDSDISAVTWNHQDIPHDPKFDDYENGPDFSTLSDRARLTGFNLDRLYTFQGPVQENRDFDDWGWRLLANFFSSFRQQIPKFVKEHMLPSTISQQPVPPSVVTDPEGKDISHVGPSEFVDLCERDISIAISGIARGEQDRFVVINPYLEHQAISDLGVTVDFDSLILVTAKPQFKGTVNISWGPVIRRTSPLAKDNHISVNLLVPRSKEDIDRNRFGRTEWWTKRFALSHIPHAHFGRIEDFVLYIFFPRMAHQKKYGSRRYWRTIIPPGDLEQFYSLVVRPATQAVQPDQYMIYAALDKQHNQFKARGSNVKMKPFSPELFPLLVESHPQLARFGSMFFVLEGKGFKLRTLGVEEPGLMEQITQRFFYKSSTASKSATRALGLLKKTFSCLDWKHMEDRSQCELYLDMALTYTPLKEETPLLGMWNIPYLQSTFEMAGFRKGTSHSAGSIGAYGALQAEMLPTRSEVTHIIHRISYNQSWEVARRDDNQRDFITASAAYAGGPHYTTPVNLAREVLYGVGPSSRQTYGMRDEWRVGYQAIGPIIEQVLDDMFQVVNNSRQVTGVWIPTAAWFAFIRTRMLAIQTLQTRLSCRQVPENLGEISGLLTYMLEALMYTPPRPSVHVTAALRELMAAEITRGFGMFFIHDLDESLANPIPALPPIDSTAVLANLKVKTAKRKPPETKHAPMETSHEYPIGKLSTIGNIQRVISSEPWTLIKEWSRGPHLDVLPEVQHLFTIFTYHVWTTLAPAYRNPSSIARPDTLDDALEMWSLAKVNAAITKPIFRAVISGLIGAVGLDVGRSFDLRTGDFFDQSLSERLPSKWAWKKWATYDKDYVALLSTHDKNTIDEQLSILLAHCQCLPSLPTKGFWQIRGGGILVDTNPRYYKLRGICDEAADQAPTKRKRGTQVHATNAELGDVFQSVSTVSSVALHRSRHTAKSKNRRNPPKRNQQNGGKGASS